MAEAAAPTPSPAPPAPGAAGDRAPADPFVQRTSNVDLGLIDDPLLHERRGEGSPAPKSRQEAAAVPAAPDPGKTQETTPPTRDDKGRFVKQGEGAEAPAEEPPAPEQAPEDAKPASAKFKFGGAEFDSQEAAEQSFRTLRGQYKSMEQRVKDSRSEAERVVGQWQESHRNLENQVRELREQLAGKRPSAEEKPRQEGATPNDEIADIIEKEIDWDFVNDLSSTRSPAEAMKWALYKLAHAMDKRASGLVEKSTAPFREITQSVEKQGKFAAVFQQAAEYTNEEGAPLYPEVRDEKIRPVIARILERLELPEEIAYSPRGIYLAVAAYRDLAGRTTQQPLSPASLTTSPSKPTPAPIKEIEDAAAASAYSEGGPGRGLPAKQSLSERDRERRVAEAILNAGRGRSNIDLGVAF